MAVDEPALIRHQILSACALIRKMADVLEATALQPRPV